jgi:xylan 1,4-beta-xylosidase
MTLSRRQFLKAGAAGLSVAPWLTSEAEAAHPHTLTYQNPQPIGVLNGLRDPFILAVDGVYYLTGTGKPFFDLDYAKKGAPKGVPLYSSPTLTDWKFEGILVPRVAGSWYQDRSWAPEIHVKQTASGRKFYCTFNCCNKDRNSPQGVGLAVADHITGPYTVLTPHGPIVEGNDANLLTDDDGADYLFIAGVSAMPIDLPNAKVTGAAWPVVTEGAPSDWDTGPGIGREGPEAIKINGTYYCFYSSWGRGYEVGYATAANIKGPWTRCSHNPIYGAQDPAACARYHKKYTQAPDVPYTEVGHGQPFIGPDGTWWISAHFGQKQKPPQADGYWGWEQPGYDPLTFEDGVFKPRTPSWTVQTVTLTSDTRRSDR